MEKDILKVLITEQALQERIGQLGKELTEAYRD